MSEPVPRPREATFRLPEDRKTPRRVKVNLPLQFLHRVLGMDHLHYGLWEGDDPLSRPGLEQAQNRYTELLLGWIPDGVHSILDVGTGTGASGLRLRGKGYEVEGLSPDPYQKELFEKRVQRPFHLGRFQEFEPARAYDLVLMSESAQYVWLHELFPAVQRAAPEGWLLVADYFVVDDSGPESIVKSGHPLDGFLQAAEAAGLRLERREDVTERAARTLDLARLWLERYVEPSLDLVGETATRRYPRLSRLAARLLRKKLRKLNDVREMVDSAEFRRCKRYEILLFGVGS